MPVTMLLRAARMCFDSYADETSTYSYWRYVRMMADQFKHTPWTYSTHTSDTSYPTRWNDTPDEMH